jgi:dihydrofolate reductase
MRIHIIVACDKTGGIAKDGKIPWYFKSDFQYFKRITMGSDDQKTAVIMGRKTWDSLPRKPLPGRLNMIITRTGICDVPDTTTYTTSIPEAFSNCLEKGITDAFIIGGEQVYRDVMETWPDVLHSIYLTKIDKDYLCDQFFPLDQIEHIGMVLESDPRKEIVDDTGVSGSVTTSHIRSELTYCHYIYPTRKTNINNELVL